MWWQHVSGGILGLRRLEGLRWYSLSNTLADVKSIPRDQLVSIARAAATAAGDDVSGYLHTLAIVTGYPGSGNVGSDVAYGISATYGQPGWRWCAKCEGIAFYQFEGRASAQVPSLLEVSKELAARGYLNERGKPYAAKSVASMLR